MQKLLIATRNSGKLGELKKLTADLPLEIVSLSDLGVTEEVVEDGKTYKENSQKKALFYSNLTNLPTLADDAGIEIAALNYEPGVKSRRWLGYEASDEELIEHMMKVSKELPDDDRDAYFTAVISLALPNGKVWSVKGKIKGIIAREPLFEHKKGYPYRSFFYLPQIGKYYHESSLTPEENRQHNHRIIALEKLKPILIKQLSL